MITDDDLRELVERVAARAPAPAPLRTEAYVIDAPRRRRWQVRAGATPVFATVVVVVVVGLCIAWFASLGGTDTKSSTAALPAAEDQARRLDESGDALGATGTGATGAGAPGAAGTGGSTGGSAAAAPPAQVPPIADTAKVIKTGAVELGVGRGTVTESVNRLTSLAVGFGGYVSDTRTTASSDSGSQATAMVSVRVPAAAFEQLLVEASKLGEVHTTTTSGQDVTAQFTDIEAQLTALRSARDQFLVVLGEAANVNDILAVQDRITQVQVQIDQLEGQQRLLADQTSFGTLTVTMLEPGATVAATAEPDDDRDLGDAWREARQRFGDALESIIEVSGTLVVVAVCLALAGVLSAFLYRFARRRALTL